jgi:tRNA nucleotidyltransferase (CCA-adding enzyme)
MPLTQLPPLVNGRFRMLSIDRLDISRFISTPRLSQLREVTKLSMELGLPAYLVGGFVRDALLKKPINDFDIVIEGDATRLGRALVKRFGGRVTVHAPFKTATWFMRDSPDDFIDLISARSEVYAQPAALPTVRMGTLDDDLHRRDFTVNAMAVPLDGEEVGELIDPLGGREDLQSGLLRILHPNSFIDDPTRLFRLIRYMVRYGFKVDSETEAHIPSALHYVDKLSPERLRHELDLILEEEDPVLILEKLWGYGIIQQVKPALPSDGTTRSRLQGTRSHFVMPPLPGRTEIQQTRNRLWTVWLLGLSEKEIRALAKRLHFTADLLKQCLAASSLFRGMDSFSGVCPSECVAWLDKFPPESVLVVSFCAPRGDEQSMLQMYLSKWRKVKPYTTGETLMMRGIPFGARIGAMLWRLRAAWLDGEVTSAEEERKLLEKLFQEGTGKK